MVVWLLTLPSPSFFPGADSAALFEFVGNPENIRCFLQSRESTSLTPLWNGLGEQLHAAEGVADPDGGETEEDMEDDIGGGFEDGAVF